MLFANDYNDNKIHIEETQSNQTYYCPYCGTPLIVKKGDIRRHHFAHSNRHQCTDSWEQNHSYDMSIWHNEWQSQFPKINQEVKLALGDIKHRADVLIDRTVVEFQHSMMSIKAFDDRNSFYFNLGYKVVWLFDLSDIFSDGKLSYEEYDDRLVFHWNNPKKAFNSYDVKSGAIDLFFQISDEGSDIKIMRVLDVSEMGFEQFYASRFISKDDFLSYVGLQNGVCSPPARDDLSKDEEYAKFCKRYNITLNIQQERAIQAIDGSVLLLAIPGSGKTTVLVDRLGYMVINKKIDPSRILAITYNKKAATEMKQRFNRKFGASIGNKVHFYTINALCYSVYLRYCKERGREIRKLIEEQDRRKIIVDILSEYSEEYPSENEILEFEQALTYIKNMMLSVDDLSICIGNIPNIKEMYKDYQRILSSKELMDFDDQMIFALAILDKRPDWLTALSSQYKYILVDEAQDTSKIQHAIIKKIAQGNNLFMVGDEDQSIYGFRGAYPKALLNFRYDYINPFIIRMERNYRSTAQIVEKAYQFISKNTGRYKKSMVSERGAGEEVNLIEVEDREEQYSYLINVAKKSNQETAFLYRDNESSVVLVDSLLRENIHFRLKSPEMNFFHGRVILDIIAYLKLTIDDHDYESLQRICNKGILYLKKQQLGYAVNDCKKRGLSVFDALEKQMQFVRQEYRSRAMEFKSFIKSIAQLPPFDAICKILERGYEEYMEEKHYDYGKVELLKILARREITIRSYLDRLRYLENQISKGFDTSSQFPIILSTIHSSKGLEYDTVYMVDVYDGRFPSKRSIISFQSDKDRADAEQEERRLFYVGITRAKNHLNLFSITQRSSSYIDELFPEVKVQREEKKRMEYEAECKRQYELQQQRLLEQKKEQARKQAEYEARQKELEEKMRKEAEELAEKKRKEVAELARKRELEEKRCMEEIMKIIDQQDRKAIDSFGRRWVRCLKCGEIKQDRDFSDYGGKNRLNLGVCSVCSRNRDQKS